MSELSPIRSGLSDLAQRTDDRAAVRQLRSIDRCKGLGIARIEAQAQVEATRAHAVGYVGQQAMQAVTMVSQMEGQLGTMCPLAVGRLQGIADMTALAARLWRALLILAFAPAVLLLVARLLSAILPAVIVAGVLLAVISVAVSGFRRRSEW